MALYSELLGVASNNDALFIQVRVACVIAANTVALEAPGTTNHINRLLWAKKVYEDPLTMARAMLWSVVAANAASPLSAFTNVPDATVQTNVNAAIDVFATGS